MPGGAGGCVFAKVDLEGNWGLEGKRRAGWEGGGREGGNRWVRGFLPKWPVLARRFGHFGRVWVWAALVALSPNPEGFKGLAARIPRSRRYLVDPSALRAMAALLLLRDKVVSPLLLVILYGTTSDELEVERVVRVRFEPARSDWHQHSRAGVFSAQPDGAGGRATRECDMAVAKADGTSRRCMWTVWTPVSVSRSRRTWLAPNSRTEPAG